MSQSRTRARKARRANGWRNTKTCVHCGEPGAHYVPPSLGEPGFWICAKIGVGGVS